MIDLTPILVALISLLAAWLTAKITPWIKTQLTNQQFDLLLTTTRVLVYAAEQVYGPGGGKQKLEYVTNELSKRGFNVDLDAIEAMVRELNIDQAMVESKTK